MNKAVLLVALLPSLANAAPAPTPTPMTAPTPSPYGTSPYVVAYIPPVITDSSHHGLTLEVALGGGSAGNGGDGALTFAIGGWLNYDLALAFRASVLGHFSMVAASAQYDVTPRLWLGAGIGSMRERYDQLYMDDQSGVGGFARAGFQLANSGSHAVYISAELQVGSVGNDVPVLGMLLLGYQML